MASPDDLFTTPTSSDASPDANSDASAGVAASDSAAPSAAPARKRAPRRATAKAAAPAPAPAESAESAETAETPAPALAADPAASADSDQAPAKRAARRSTAKKAAATKTTAKKATAKKATKKAAKSAPAAPAATDVAAVLGADAAMDDETDVTIEVSAADEATSVSTSRAATVPSFGVLFQAPDPTAATTTSRRRRAAVRPAGPAPVTGAGESTEPSADLGSSSADAPQDRADQNRADQDRADQDRADQDRADQDRADQDRADQDRADQDRADQDRVDQEGAEEGEGSEGGRRRRRRGGKGRGRGRGAADEVTDSTTEVSEAAREAEETSARPSDDDTDDSDTGSSRRRRRRRRSGAGTDGEDPPGTVTRVREARRDEPQSVKGSTRLEAKKQRRREGREAGRRRTIITEAEFLARRESVDRVMVVREREGRTQIGVLEDGVLVEHYVSRETNASMAGNVYLGRVQNVLPSMEAAFVDIGKGRNAVLYAGEVNWDAAGLESNQPKRIENALKSGDSVLVQVTKDPIGHKGARLTSQVSLPGRYLVFVPEGSMTGISRKLPDTERSRLKGILKEVLPDSAGVIVRTAAEGASEDELRADVERLTKTWDAIQKKAESKASGKGKGSAPALVHGEPDLTVRVIRDVFNEDFNSLVVAGEQAWSEVSEYLGDVAPDLAERLQRWTSEEDLFTHYRVDEQIAKAMDRKVWLPSGGSLVIDRTEAMTVIDVNTGKFVGSGGNLEETVTKNNIEAAEEIVRQLRLRDIGGIIVIDFIDMVLESNRDLVVRRLLECLGRDRTKHQVAEVTSLGLVQMTRKRVGSGLIEVFSENCEHCGGRGIIVHADPVDKPFGGSDSGNGGAQQQQQRSTTGRGRRGRSGSSQPAPEPVALAVHGGPTPAQIAAAAHAAALKSTGDHHDEQALAEVGDHEPDVEPALEAVAQPVSDDLSETAQQQPATPATASAGPAAPQPDAMPAEPAPRRRKRGRVVAPAGPPRHAEPQDSGAAS